VPKNRAPSFQFYPDDWMSDAELSSCSISAQGLWIYMLCIMHKSPRQGYLLLANGEKFADERLMRCRNIPESEFGVYMIELESAGVFSRTPEGIIFSRRMSRDACERKKYRNWQRAHRDKQGRMSSNGQATVKQMKPLSSSPSSSPSPIQIQKKEKSTTAQAPLPEWCPLDAWNDFRLMRQKIRKPMTGRAEQLVLQKLDSLRLLGQDPKAVLEQSICNSWQGIFPVKVSENGNGNSASKTSQQAERVAAMLSANRS
jgi:hypothetical protein